MRSFLATYRAPVLIAVLSSVLSALVLLFALTVLSGQSETAKVADANRKTNAKVVKVLVQKQILRKGPRGLVGGRGPIGKTGAQGPRGAHGDPGTPGTNGKTGPAGADGAPGKDGTDGKDAAPCDARCRLDVLEAYCKAHDCVQTGPRGATGAQGPQGLPGAPGSPPAAFSLSNPEHTQALRCTKFSDDPLQYDCVQDPPPA